MITLMFWPDNESNEKQRIEQEQRARKKDRSKSSPPPRPPVPPMEPASVSDSDKPKQVSSISDAIDSNEELKKALEIISQQNTVAKEQSSQIKALTDALTQQQHIVEKLVERPTVVASGAAGVVEEEDGFPKLEEVDIPVINTSGIEVGYGTAGETRDSSVNINSKVERLKKLKRGTKK